jgi:hypothetical protein
MAHPQMMTPSAAARCSWSRGLGFLRQPARLELQRRNWVLCPFHDQIASLVFDPFACQRHRGISFRVRCCESVVLGSCKRVFLLLVADALRLCPGRYVPREG